MSPTLTNVSFHFTLSSLSGALKFGNPVNGHHGFKVIKGLCLPKTKKKHDIYK